MEIASIFCNAFLVPRILTQTHTHTHTKDCVDRFYQSHAHRPGIAVLAFLVEDVNLIHQRYQKLHSNLVVGLWDYPKDHVKILEVYAYYGKDLVSKQPDQGTILRFVQDNRPRSHGNENNAKGSCPVPGLSMIEATFDDTTQPAYCDHWVSNGMYYSYYSLSLPCFYSHAGLDWGHPQESNARCFFLPLSFLSYHGSVFHRKEFLNTLEDTLDFTPKVSCFFVSVRYCANLMTADGFIDVYASVGGFQCWGRCGRRGTD